MAGGVAKASQQLSTFRRILAKAEMPEDAIKVGAGAAGIEDRAAEGRAVQARGAATGP